MSTPTPLLAAVDLGSNSFRLIIGRVEETSAGTQIYQVDALREPVRLAAGLNAEKYLDHPSQQRGWDVLKRFGERLRGFHPDQVRAVATNTLRVAKNAQDFLGEAQRALGFPIEVIAGREEARLIYAGAAHSVPTCPGNRLVVDIGGGSTEFIIGEDYEPIIMESLYIGCVSHSRQFFPSGNVDEYAMKQAELAARREIQIISAPYRDAGWSQAIGSSGTARALAELLEANGFNDGGVHGLTRGGLERLKRALIKAENANRLKLSGLKQDRIPVLPGGLSIMLSVFNELEVEHMETTDAALRLGVMYDLLGRTQHQDMRAVTVEQFVRRYGVDRAQAERVGRLAIALYRQLPVAGEDADDGREDDEALLSWAASLHEMGLSISHSAYHKHSAYIGSNADMPGFSRPDQARLAELLLGHVGKLGKLAAQAQQVDWQLLFCLRLAVLFCRRRTDALPDSIEVERLGDGFQVSVPRVWIEANPLTDYSLQREAQEWEKIGMRYKVVYA
ncbi:exopolyphosphatase [Pandoraea pnomenusa]|jgi:exopolyphosphatase/guanosine-5'-triphosphate,3'-diphosphate pyrophosphatase|uniref:Exopolyphosphatase n=1 Tax=Pandoraea pnomenusa TaxID=93220 RepID=A0A378YFZ3_9BURK|nr:MULTISPECIES: exopolyphosphatase [Pandoraea]AHB05270.2 exopolyphosphatase [Pandoraea pnomenusa 3kgm]AHB74358.1 exopolyphosphatase [Pandoraea pnomenusa]AHN73049.1 exopolyphosphatase [Pandoraea pnomenusa]AIU26164.1 exopolyphosphatase [Pandoraea pnomenusa]ANC43397.1 exopolyphosphatase [Pandoraea pnomenusa]